MNLRYTIRIEVIKMADKNELIAIRLNTEQLVAVKQLAQRANVSVSTVIRSAIEHMTGVKAE